MEDEKGLRDLSKVTQLVQGRDPRKDPGSLASHPIQCSFN